MRAVVSFGDFLSPTRALPPRHSTPRATILDSFTDTNGTSFASHTPDIGAAGQNLNGTWTIQSNTLAPPAGSETVCSYATGATAYRFEAVIASGLAGDPGMCVRVQDSTNYCMLQINSSGTSAIYKRVTGVYTALNTPVSVPWANADTVWIDVTPNTITVYRNNVQVMSAADTTFSSLAKVGFRSVTTSTTVRFDNARVLVWP